MSPFRRFLVLSAFVLGWSRLPALEREFIDEFEEVDGQPPEGWIIPMGLGDWQVQAGELSIEANPGKESWIWLDRPFAGDIAIDLNIAWPDGGMADGVGRHGGIAFFANFPDGKFGSRYDGMSGYTMDWIDRASDHGIRMHRWINGGEAGLLQDGLFTDVDPPGEWRVEIHGDTISIILDGQPFQDVVDTSFRSGYVGFWMWSNNIHATYDNLHIANPDLVVNRAIPSELVNGTSGQVKLTVDPYKPGVVAISETLPDGLTPSSPSNGGTLAGSTITWNLGNIGDEVVLSYTLGASDTAADSTINGGATLDGQPFPIFGDSAYTGSPITTNGFIKLWNHLGPLAWQFPVKAGDSGQSCLATDINGVPQLPLDWIVNADGTVTEANILPFPGLVTRPAYGGDGVVPGGTGARAAGLTVQPTDTGLVVQDRYPVWKGGFTRGDTIDEASSQVNGLAADDQITMSCTYVTNHTGAPISTNLGYANDDSIQILLNDVDLTSGGTLGCQGVGPSESEPNSVPVTLPDGESRLLVKVANGGSPAGFRLRFQNPTDPTLPGLQAPDITVSQETARNLRPGDVVRSVSKDTYALGEKVDVTLNASLKAASALKIHETLPANSIASAISDGGALVGNTIEWSLASVAKKSVSYQITGDTCGGDLAFLQSSFTVGSVEVAVTGASGLQRTVGNDDLGAWDNRNIGAATTGGGAEKLGDHQLLLSATGDGIKLQKDSFRLVSVPQSGDFEFSARIDCMDDPGAKGVIGLMVRDSVDEGGANAFFGMSAIPPATGGAGTLKGTYRAGDTKSTSPLLPSSAPKDVTSLPIYLKIKRAGTALTFQRSPDGATYTDVVSKVIGSGAGQINLPNDNLIGLAGTNGGAGLTTRASLGAVSGPPFGASQTPNPPQSLAATSGTKKVSLAWSAPAAGPAPGSYLVQRSSSLGGPYTQVAEVTAPATAYDDTGLDDNTQYCYVVASKKGTAVSANSNESCAKTAAVGGGPTFRRGDVDSNGVVEITDAVKLLGYLFLGGGTPECLEAGDTDNNGTIDITDAVTNLGYQFLGQAPPAAPGPLTCGTDPAQPMLGCDKGCQ
jgi:hypothetical protein